MTEIGRWLTRVAVGLLVLVFFIAGLVSLSRLMQEKELLFTTYRRGTWAVVQLEAEYLKLRQEILHFWADPGASSVDELLLRLDIFWSRLPIILESEEGEHLRQIPGLQEKLQAILDTLPALERAILALDHDRPESFQSLLAAADAFRDPIQEVTQRSLIQDAYVYNRERLYQRHTETLAAFLVLAAAGAIIVAVLIRQLVHSQRLFAQARAAEAETSAARADLQEAVKMLRKRLVAMESSIDGIAIVDWEGRFGYVNEAYARIFGYESIQHLLGRPWDMLYAEDGQRHFREQVLPALPQSRHWRGEALGRRRDGTLFPQEVSLTALDNGEFIAIVRDITERRHAETERTQLQEQFYQAQKMEAIGRLSGGIAHDFNNILAAMMGYATFLTEDLPRESPQQQFAQQILLAGERAKRLVQQILAFSRSRNAVPQQVDLAELTRETVGMLEATLLKSLKLVTRLPATPVWVLADPAQMTQVLMNLCVNAGDAMDNSGGTLTLEVAVRDIDGGCAHGLLATNPNPLNSPPVRIADGPDGAATRMWVGVLQAPGRFAQITVADTGCGMTRAVMERMFEPFFTTKEVGKGSGLGLAAVHGIIIGHGGAMMVESRPGAGTAFNLFLPLAEQPVPAGAKAPALRPPRGRERLLVVDDEDQVAAVVGHALERLGYEVATCTSAAEALEAIDEAPGVWDLVVTDQVMPGGSGLDLARQLALRDPNLPVVLCTGFADACTTEVATACGIDAILLKPVDLDQLAETVRRLLDARGVRRAAPDTVPAEPV